jgi:hypothetical protein
MKNSRICGREMWWIPASGIPRLPCSPCYLRNPGMGLTSQLRSHGEEFVMTSFPSHVGYRYPTHANVIDPRQLTSLTSSQRSNSNELARMVSLCVHFLTCLYQYSCLYYIYFRLTINCVILVVFIEVRHINSLIKSSLMCGHLCDCFEILNIKRVNEFLTGQISQCDSYVVSGAIAIRYFIFKIQILGPLSLTLQNQVPMSLKVVESSPSSVFSVTRLSLYLLKLSSSTSVFASLSASFPRKLLERKQSAHY